MVTASDPTLLRLVGIGVMPYSARGLTQTLAPIDAAQQLERTINGELLDLCYEPFRKYKSTISGSDQRPPVCDGVWPGRIVTVDCLAQIASAEYAPFGREPVDDQVLIEAGYAIYRPRLTMMVMNFTMSEDEWAAGIQWSMDLEEV